MSIAEQIMLGTQQTNVLAQNLSALGQQVGRQLAINQYQKDAAAVLPAMRESYKSAFNKMGQGKYADGYMELLNTNLQFGATTNPFIAQFAEQANQTAKQMESALWRQAQYGGGGAGGGPRTIPGMRVPTAQELSDPNYTPDETVFDTTVTDVNGGGDMEARFVGTDMTQGTPAQRRMQAQVDQEYKTYQDADRAAAAGLPAMDQQEGFSFGAGVLSQYRPEKQTIDRTKEEVISFKGLSREEKDAYKEQVIATEAEYTPPQGRVAQPFQGMIGFEDAQYIEGPAKGGFRVASIEEDYDEKGQKITRKLEPANNDDVNTFNGFVANMDKTNRFVSRNPKLRKMLEAAGGNPNRIDISEQETDTGEIAYRATIDGQDYGTLSTAPDFNERLAIEFLQDAPAVIRRNGWRVIKGEAPAEAPSPAAGGAGERFPVKQGAAPAPAQPAPTTAPRELSLAEQISATVAAPETPATPSAPRKQAERRGAAAARTSTQLNKERDELRRALYQVTSRGEVRGLKKGLDPENPTVKRGIERLKEIEKELASL